MKDAKRIDDAKKELAEELAEAVALIDILIEKEKTCLSTLQAIAEIYSRIGVCKK